jgi:hypothetical protein
MRIIGSSRIAALDGPQLDFVVARGLNFHVVVAGIIACRRCRVTIMRTGRHAMLPRLPQRKIGLSGQSASHLD